MRVVLDSSVLVAGLRSRNGASFVILRLVRSEIVVPIVTVALFLEYEDVLKRDEHLGASEMRADVVDRFLGAFAVAAEPVEVHLRWRPQLRDVGDEFVLEAAINGRADVLVTHNTRDFRAATPRFGVTLMSPGALLAQHPEWRMHL